MSLRSQLFALISVLFFAVLGVVLAVSISDTRKYLEQQLASHAQDAATAMSVTLGQSLGKGDVVLAQAQVASVFDRGFFKSVEVLDANRQSVLKKELPQKIEQVPDWFVTVVPIETPPGEAFVGSGWRQLGKVLVVSQPTYAYQHLWNSSVQMLQWLALIFFAGLAMVHGVLHFILKPLRAIEKSARDVQDKRFEQIDQRPSAPELGRVVDAMNQMSRRVGEMLDQETAKAQSLYQQAYIDEVSGLYNRRGYELRLSELLQGEIHFALGAVICVELDDMRLLNRAHGFAAGEHIMRTVADSARAVLSNAPITLFARSNEFSFSFVVADVSHDEVVRVATELRKRILQELADYVPMQMAGMNIGTAFFEQSDRRSEIFSRSDFAVESARQSERNGFVILDEQPDEHTSLGSFGWRKLIQTALVENRWRLLRQPVLSLNVPQQVLQGECMARLVDEQGELVPAANFMPMAARHQLMPEVDRAMVTLAFAHLKEHPDDVAMVAVNLSPQSVASSEFMDWFGGKLNAMGHAAKRLAVEVSEYGALRNVQATSRVRELVRRHGARFGIDHFGLDPDALKLLREMPPDYVKLTGTLMAEIEAVEAASDMLKSFVKLAHSLDVMVIAQQVERAEQIGVLTAAGVDAGQGYYFGAPQ